MDPNLVILAGGISSRMKKPASSSRTLDPMLQDDALHRTKSMIRTGHDGRPFLDYLLYNAWEAGCRDIVIVIGETDQSIRDHYGKNDRGNRFHGLTISYVIQPIPEGRTKPLGTADALLRVLKVREDWKDGKFTVCNADNLYSAKALRLLLEATHECATIDYDRKELRFEESRIHQFAVTQKDEEGFLKTILEKPSGEELRAAADATGTIRVSMNIFRLTYGRILPFLENLPLHPVHREKVLSLAVTSMVKAHARSMYCIPLAEHVPDMTLQSDIPEVQEFLRRSFSQIRWAQ